MHRSLFLLRVRVYPYFSECGLTVSSGQARTPMTVTRHTHPNRLGFSLIEVLVAMGAVTVGVLALMAVFITGTRSNQHGADLSRATYYARKISETVRQDGLAFSFSTIPPDEASGLNDPPNLFRALDDQPPANVFRNLRIPLLNEDGSPRLGQDQQPMFDPGDEKFRRNIRIQRAHDSLSDYRYQLLWLDVTIRWQGGKSGDGLRRVQIRSLLKTS